MQKAQHVKNKKYWQGGKAICVPAAAAIDICQHRGEVQKGSMTFPRLLKESAANWSGTPHSRGPFPDDKTIYFFILV